MIPLKIAGRIEMWLIERLTPSARSARTHSGQQIRPLARSIRECGFVKPVELNPYGDVITRHGRILAVQYATQKNGRAIHDCKGPSNETSN